MTACQHNTLDRLMIAFLTVVALDLTQSIHIHLAVRGGLYTLTLTRRISGYSAVSRISYVMMHNNLYTQLIYELLYYSNTIKKEKRKEKRRTYFERINI